ncbi:T9SS type A sorting domain-containing protein [Cellulophaga lytica]|uniref:T9SS type A sorting domain-containing protein n=1 Tax=Cellulophaga lytica TaxID=979 RepID=UPI0026E12A5B|nr:T9SS type A sorting domain-containing protein [Cellulophaga lytica]MDO6852619.1 T9SS type A sorting domain-containing protein [Cellulophaga lytica]
MKLKIMKPKKVFLSFLLAFICLLGYSQKPNGQTSNPNDNFKLLNDFSDEFNTGNINWSKWSRTANLPNTKAWKWDNNANAKPVNYKGERSVELTMRQNANNARDGITYFKSGCLQTIKQLPKNFVGYVESRIYGAEINSPKATGLDKYRGVCPSFWLYSKFFDNKPIGEAVYTEIDVVELQQFDFDPNGPVGHQQDLITDAESNLHLVKKASFGRDWFRPKQPKARAAQLNKYELPGKFDPTKGWHTYGCEITPTKLYFYVDGKRVGKALNNTYWSDNPMYVIASLGLRVPFVAFQGNVFEPVNPEVNPRAKKNIDEMPVSMHVDYIRVWEKNGAGGNNNATNGNCSSVPVWKKSGAFSRGDKVKLNNAIYELKAGTGTCRPGGASGCSSNQWTKVFDCESNSSIINTDAGTVYPNPANTVVNVVATKGDFIRVITSVGTVVRTIKAKNSTTIIDISALPPGLYTVTITGNNKNETKQLLIQ